VIEDSAQNASSIGRQLAKALEEQGIENANVVLIYIQSGKGFQGVQELLRTISLDIRMILIDVADDDEVKRARSAKRPLDARNRTLFPGIPLLRALRRGFPRASVMGLSRFSREVMAEAIKDEYPVLYKPTLRSGIAPYLDALKLS